MWRSHHEATEQVGSTSRRVAYPVRMSTIDRTNRLVRTLPRTQLLGRSASALPRWVETFGKVRVIGAS